MSWINLFDVYPDAEVAVYSSQEGLEARVEGGRVVLEADDIGSGGGDIVVTVSLKGQSRKKVRLSSVEAEAVDGGNEWSNSSAACGNQESGDLKEVSPAVGSIEFSSPLPWDILAVGVERAGI